GRLRQQRHRSGPPDGTCQLALVTGTAPRDPPWRDLSPLRDEPPESADVLVVDETDLVHAELADFAAAKAAPLDGLPCWWNGVSSCWRSRELAVARRIRRERAAGARTAPRRRRHRALPRPRGRRMWLRR